MSRHNAGRPRASTRLTPGVGRLEGRLLPSADVLTYHNDNMRSGWDHDETTLTPASVNPQSFGKLFNMPVDGKVDAQPLVMDGVNIPGQGVHDVVFIATENDSVYAFDADTGALLWHVSMLPPGETTIPLSDADPHIGITSTPVIDPSSGTIYVVAASRSFPGGLPTDHQRLHALSVATGADLVAARSIDQSITYPGTGPGGNGTSVIFDPKFYRERDALLLSGGVVYTSWSSYYDTPPYTGWVIGFRASDLGVASILNIDPNGQPNATFLDDGSGNSFWNSDGGPAADVQGNVYNISANGPFDTTLNAAGYPSGGDYGDSFLKMTPVAGGLVVADYFTPAVQASDAFNDFDLGSSGIALADEPGPGGATLHLAVGSDKLGDIYVVNRDYMGQFHASGDAIVQELPGALGGGEFGTPAVFGNVVYFGAVGRPILAFSFVDGLLVPVGLTSTSFVYPGATPAVSSNGIDDGILWATENTPGAVLHAYLASNPSVELYNSSMAPDGRDSFGVGNKFIAPTVSGGKVYVATTSGVAAFGLRLTPPPIFSAPPHASASPTVGNFVTLTTAAVDASYPPSYLAYFWGTLSAPPGVATPLFSATGTNAAQSTVAYVSTPGTYIFDVVVADPSGTLTECLTVVDVVAPAAPALAAAPAIAAYVAPAPVATAAAPMVAVAPTSSTPPASPARLAPGSGLALAPATPAVMSWAETASAWSTSPPAWGAGRTMLITQELEDVAQPFAVYPRGDRRPFARSAPQRWLA